MRNTWSRINVSLCENLRNLWIKKRGIRRLTQIFGREDSYDQGTQAVCGIKGAG
jgi:hypothetical protein